MKVKGIVISEVHQHTCVERLKGGSKASHIAQQTIEHHASTISTAVKNGPITELVITEGVSGLWHYHISREDKKTRALCGAQTMHTSIQLKDWKVQFGEHFPKRPTWCSHCESLGILPRVVSHE